MKKFITSSFIIAVLSLNNNVYATEPIKQDIVPTQEKLVQVQEKIISGNGATYKLLTTGKVQVKGSNTHGQLGLGIATNVDVVDFKDIINISDIIDISYDDYTLTMKKSDNEKYIFGKNAYGPAMSQYSTYSNFIISKESNIPQKITYSNSKITKIERYTNTNLNVYSQVTNVYASTILISTFNTNKTKKQTNNYYFSSNLNYKTLVDFYSNNVINKEIDYFYKNKQITVINNYNYYNKKKETIYKHKL